MLLSRGLLPSISPSHPTGGGDDLRHHLPRFQRGNLDNDLALVQPLRELAEEKGARMAQLATAWALAQGDDIIPLIGARRRTRLRDSLASLDIQLDEHDLRRIEASVRTDAVAGARDDAGQMARLDSEQSMGSTGG